MTPRPAAADVRAARVRVPRTVASVQANPSLLDDRYRLVWRCAVAGLPEPVCEYAFAPPRRWRFDYAFIEQKVAVEVDGGLFSGGRHARGAGIRKDYEKRNNAAILGWRMLHFLPEQVESGEAIDAIERTLRGRP